MKGDVLFYMGKPDSIICDLIRWRTAGPFVHVEVDMGDGTAIGALTKGVSRHPLIPTAYIFKTSQKTDDSNIEQGLRFLVSEVNSEYGWNDILDAVLPSWWRLIVKDKDAFDCSHLVAKYLIIANAVKFPQFVIDRIQSVSPNDLAIYCRLRIWET